MRRTHLLLLCLVTLGVRAAEPCFERLDRGLVAVRTSSGVFLSWRLLDTDSEDVSFQVLRDGTPVRSSGYTVTNAIDSKGTANSTYVVQVLEDGEVVRHGKATDTVIALQLKDFYRRQKMVESLSQEDLNDLIAMQNIRGDETVKFSLIEKYTRTATPFSAFVLTVIAVSLSSRKKRGGLGINIGIGLALSFIYILFMRFSQMFVHTGTLPPGLAIWLPNMVFAIVAAVLYRIAPK